MVSHLVLRLVLHNMSSGQVSSSVAERVEALALLGIPQSGRLRVQSQVAAGAKYGEFSSREKSDGFSPEKRRSKFDNANHGEALDKIGL